MEPMPPTDETKMNKNTYISLGVVVLIIGATLWIKEGQQISQETAKSVEKELIHYKEIQKLSSDLVAAKIDALAEIVRASGTDRYTGRDHRIFVERLQELNPSLKIPRPADK